MVSCQGLNLRYPTEGVRQESVVDLVSQNIEERNAGSKSFRVQRLTFSSSGTGHTLSWKKKKRKKNDLRDYLAGLRESKANPPKQRLSCRTHAYKI